LLLLLSPCAGTPTAWAAGNAEDRTQVPEEDDFASTPHTQYGEFSEDEDEAETLRFYQYGRLFGVGFGLGGAGATGKRGLLFQTGFPTVDLRTTYWFDFNFALDLAITNMKFDYDHPATNAVNVNITAIGLDLKYYFDTRDASAPIAFANPYLIGGFGSYTYSQFFTNDNSTEKDSSFGLSGGMGLEFAIKPKKVSFGVCAKIHSVKFKDTDTARFASQDPKIDNMNGLFYSVIAGFLFTW
jgi:hypothetical protein